VDRDHPSPRSGVHLVIAGERVKAHHAHVAPDPTRVAELQAGFRVIDLPELQAMKLQSDRDIDRAHVRDMLSVGLIDASWVKRLPEDLGRRHQEILSRPE